MARWWDRLGGRPVDHAASPRFISCDTQPSSAKSKSKCNVSVESVKRPLRKPSALKGDITTPFHSIERVDYTSFTTGMQDKKQYFCFFRLPRPAGGVRYKCCIGNILCHTVEMGAAGNGERDFKMVDKLVVSVAVGLGRGEWFGGGAKQHRRRLRGHCDTKNRDGDRGLQTKQCVSGLSSYWRITALCSPAVRSFRQGHCPTVFCA